MQRNARKITLFSSLIGLLLLAGCDSMGIRNNEQECQWQGKPSNYCHQTAKADSYFTKGNTANYFIPAYTGPKDFPVPDMPVYADETLDQTLHASIVLGDYTKALQKTDLLSLAKREGPYTFFAVPNQAMEKPNFFVSGSLMDVENEPLLKQLMGYTIVMGDYPVAKLRQLIQANGGFAILTTFYNDKLIVSIDPATNELITKNGAGEVNRIWINGIPQANGTIYVTQGLLKVGSEGADASISKHPEK